MHLQKEKNYQEQQRDAPAKRKKLPRNNHNTPMMEL